MDHEDAGKHMMDDMNMGMDIHVDTHGIQACNDRDDEEVAHEFPISRVPIEDREERWS